MAGDEILDGCRVGRDRRDALRKVFDALELRWARRLAAMTFFGAWLVGGIAGRLSSIIEDFGWAIMATSGLIWCAAIVAMRFFRRRST